jgi:hypothetical protein
MCILNGLVTAFVHIRIMHWVFVHVDCHPKSSAVLLNGSNSIVLVRIFYGPLMLQPPWLQFVLDGSCNLPIGEVAMVFDWSCNRSATSLCITCGAFVC